MEKYRISQEAYDQRQGMGHMGIKGGGVCGAQKECVQGGGSVWVGGQKE